MHTIVYRPEFAKPPKGKNHTHTYGRVLTLRAGVPVKVTDEQLASLREFPDFPRNESFGAFLVTEESVSEAGKQRYVIDKVRDGERLTVEETIEYFAMLNDVSEIRSLKAKDHRKGVKSAADTRIAELLAEREVEETTEEILEG